MAVSGKLFDFLLPTKSVKKDGVSVTETYEPGKQDVLSVPDYRDHLNDLLETRQTETSKELLQNLFNNDPDCSAAVNSYLTISDTEPVIIARNSAGEIDREGTKLAQQVIYNVTSVTDYTLGFQVKKALRALREELKYMLLLRGSAGAELIFNALLVPSDIRNVDMGSIEWFEKKPGLFKPLQKTTASNQEISLDIPTFFTCSFRRDPTTPYTTSFFVSAINSISARQQVINDLYRIMQITGYPRVTMKVVEEVLRKNAPANTRENPDLLRSYVNARMRDLTAQFSSVRADQVFAHTDTVEVKMLNEKNPGASLQIEEVVNFLNAQNQAALKTVSTLLGRGQAGVNTASVESRVFSMNADQLNKPIDEMLSEIFTLAVRMQGFDGFVTISSLTAELRPELELEPQKVMKQSRLHKDLSLGLITDNQYHLEMYGKLSEDGVPELSGTGFEAKGIDTSDVSSNSDPLGRSLTPEGSDSAKSNTVK